MNPKAAEYGDNTFPGRGRIKCGLCLLPLRDHPIGPCPNPPADKDERLAELAKHKAPRNRKFS